MSNQEDCLRSTTRQVHPWTPADGENPHQPRIEKWLFGMLLAWPIVVWICGMFGASVQKPFTDYMVFLGSPVVAAILGGVAIRRYPVTRKFLRTLVGLLLVVTILWGGFFQSASLAHEEKLLSTMKHTTPHVTFISYRTLVSLPMFPVSDADINGTLRGTLIGVFGYASLLLSPYAPMLGPYYLLVLLIIPHFLALPVYWLWVVLSALYVVLPVRAWGWLKAVVVRGWRKVVAHSH